MRRHAPLLAVVVLQLVLLANVPARTLLARFSGTDITLMTRPVDPYDLFLGYNVTLAYAVEQVPAALRPDGLASNTPIWLELAPAQPAWGLVRVHTTPPTALPGGHALIQALWRDRHAEIHEASRLYIAEGDRNLVADAVDKAAGRVLVDLRVSPDGHPAVLRMRIGDRVFGE